MLGRSSQRSLETSSPGPAVEVVVAAAVAVAAAATETETETEAVAVAPPPQNENPLTRGGGARVQVCYNAHLPALSLRDGENPRSVLVGTVFPTLHGAVLCKNWHLCGSFWEYFERKRSPIPTPPEGETTVAGLLKAAQGGLHACLQPSGGRPSSP